MAIISQEVLQNKIHPILRLNSICPYFTMFPLSFPYGVLGNAKKTDLIYDPFCGRGTTNYAARLLGLNSFGVDSSPVAHAIAQAKLIQATAIEITDLCLHILQSINSATVPKGEFWRWAYHEETLINICKLRKYFASRSHLTKSEVALKAIILGILHGPLMKTQFSYLSNQMPRTFATKPDYSVKYWKKKKLKPKRIDLSELVFRKAEYIFNEQLPNNVKGKIVKGDSRTIGNLNEEKFNWVITSPPYLGMSTYEQDQWLRKWFLNGPEEIDYSYKNQIKHGSELSFAKDLAKVWKNTAEKCEPNAKLVIRFGALPSQSEKTPSDLIKESLKLADCGWILTTIRKAGKPQESHRQANQFKNSAGGYIEEIDAFASLNT